MQLGFIPGSATRGTARSTQPLRWRGNALHIQMHLTMPNGSTHFQQGRSRPARRSQRQLAKSASLR
jgi:hypothetical protein